MELKETFSLNQSHFFCYLQVKHFVKNNLKNVEDPPKEHSFYVLVKHPGSKYLVSDLWYCLPK